MIKAVAVIILSLVLTIKSITATGPVAKTAAWHTGKTQMRHQLHEGQQYPQYLNNLNID